jgi:two-component system, NarL family, sensor histidine kinase UhpB
MSEESKKLQLTTNEIPPQDNNVIDNTISRYHKVFNLMPERVWHIQSDGRVASINDAASADLGLPAHLIIGKTLNDLFPQAIASRLNTQNTEIVKTGKPALGIVEEHMLSSGNIGWFRVDKLPYFDYAGHVIGVVIFAFDITHYKKTEEALYTSRIQISEAMDLARIVYWQLNPKTDTFIFNDPFYTFYSTTAEREGGYLMTREEYRNRFVHPDDMALFNQAKEKRIKFGDHEFFNDVEHRIIRRDGQVRHVIARIRAILDDSGRTIRCYGANQDISDRKQAEEQLEKERLLKEIQLRKEKALEQSREELRHLSEHLQRVRERERTRIAREVHDEVGQFLTALKIDLTFLGQGLFPEQNAISDQIKAMENKIDSAVHKVREICSELRPSILDDFGLPAAIEWHAGEYEKKTGIKFVVKIDPDIPIIEKRLASVIFRIFQEAVTNVIRHAEATKVRINLKEDGEMLALKVSDNGKGISKKSIYNPGSLGIIGIRERVRFWNGEIQFKTSKSNGTTIIVSIPHTFHRVVIKSL